MVDKDQMEWEIVLEEFKSLRTEILGKTENAYKILGLLVTGIGTLLGVAIQSKIFTLALVLPLVIIISIFLFESEGRAIVNAAKYISMVENEYIKNDEIIGWEKWLENNPDKKRIYHVFGNVSLVVLFIMYIGCIFIVIVFPEDAIDSHFINPNFKYFAGLIYLSIGIGAIYYIHTYVDSMRSERKM